MNTTFIQEPELQFGSGRHIDIRFGIAKYKPLDYRDPLAPKNIQHFGIARVARRLRQGD